MSKNNPPEKCLNCGYTIFVKQGIDHTKQGRFQRWKCTMCATTVKGDKL